MNDLRVEITASIRNIYNERYAHDDEYDHMIIIIIIMITIMIHWRGLNDLRFEIAASVKQVPAAPPLLHPPAPLLPTIGVT